MNEITVALRTESSAVLERGGATIRVTFRLKNRELHAAGPMELESTVANETPARIFYLAGSVGMRPAYMKFSAELHPPGLVLRDPYPDTALEPKGLFASISLQPGQIDRGTVILNQFVTLEDTREAIPDGQCARLHVRWWYFIAASSTEEYPSKIEPVEGDFQVTLVRNDDKMRDCIDAIAAKLMNDSNAIPVDAVGRRDAIVKLTSLRIPEVIPHLRRLADFPDFEVRRMAQYALSELEHEPKR
jgi:hypothetical protein